LGEIEAPFFGAPKKEKRERKGGKTRLLLLHVCADRLYV